MPQALLHNLKHNQVLHERNMILTVVFHEVPWIPADERVEVEPLAPRLLARARALRLHGHARHAAGARRCAAPTG